MVFTPKRTDQQIEQATLLHKQGKAQTEIGKIQGVSHMTIGRALRKQGISTSPIRNTLPSDVPTLAYLAGLFDGEGSINIFKQPNQRGRITPCYFMEISLGNTHKGVLQWLLENFGGRLTHNAEQTTEKQHKAWRWRASTQEAAPILQAILPYLIVKKDLTERWQSCECGTELDRDVNAAINILARGRRQLSAMAVEAPYPSGERALHGTKVPKTF